jgi:hypothetical protein
MTSRAVRQLRRKSKLRPTSTSASDRLKTTYQAWCLLMTSYRCWANRQEDPRNPSSDSPVSLRWVSSFDDFVEDMGFRPQGMVLVTLDPALPAGPGNCRWGKRGVPGQRGRRPTRYITHDGQTRTVAEWSALLRVPYKTIYSRIKRGADGAQALALTGERS